MYVVAGVTGHVGSVVADTLLAAKEPVRVYVRDEAKGAAWAKKGAQVAVGALDDEASLARALQGAKGFFTLLPPNYAAQDFYVEQRRIADAIAAAVKKSGVPHAVILSSVGADVAVGNGPIKGLHYLEQKLRETGVKLTAIRAGSFQENFQNVLGAARGAGVFPNFAPSADFAYPQIATKDIGALAAEVLRKPAAKGEIVDLHGPAYSNRDIAKALGSALGKELKIVDVPAPAHVDALVQAGFSKQIAEAFAEMYAGFASGKLVPRGDRLVQGRTTIEETVRASVH